VEPKPNKGTGRKRQVIPESLRFCIYLPHPIHTVGLQLNHGKFTDTEKKSMDDVVEHYHAVRNDLPWVMKLF
jgi:hypothetical protein